MPAANATRSSNIDTIDNSTPRTGCGGPLTLLDAGEVDAGTAAAFGSGTGTLATLGALVKAGDAAAASTAADGAGVTVATAGDGFGVAFGWPAFEVFVATGWIDTQRPSHAMRTPP